MNQAELPQAVDAIIKESLLIPGMAYQRRNAAIKGLVDLITTEKIAVLEEVKNLYFYAHGAVVEGVFAPIIDRVRDQVNFNREIDTMIATIKGGK